MISATSICGECENLHTLIYHPKLLLIISKYSINGLKQPFPDIFLVSILRLLHRELFSNPLRTSTLIWISSTRRKMQSKHSCLLKTSTRRKMQSKHSCLLNRNGNCFQTFQFNCSIIYLEFLCLVIGSALPNWFLPNFSEISREIWVLAKIWRGCPAQSGVQKWSHQVWNLIITR